jgi:DNA-binding LacI/PurR family transcriptional regulator
MVERRVDGVAILTFGMEESLLHDLRLRQVPLVFVDVGPDAPRVSNIRIDYQSGIRQAVQHLAALRHTAIAFVAGPLHLKSAVARRDAFKTSMSEIGLEVAPELMVVGDHTMDGGMRALGELMRLRRRPTAVLCSNDMTAIGVMREAYDLGISVPRDFSVVGFDDIRLSEFMIPPLSTIQMSQSELARIAFKALMDDVAQAGPAEGRREYPLHTSLILRRSTALAPVDPIRRKLSRNRPTSATAKS